jgi:hypothetical protein
MKSVIILIHAFIGWIGCGLIMALGMQYMSLYITLIIHAIGAPLIFGFISTIYFKKFGFTTPLQTGLIFVFFIIFMDFFVVSMIIEKSFDMFKSALGTWIPFVLIFLSIYFTGNISLKKNSRAGSSLPT